VKVLDHTLLSQKWLVLFLGVFALLIKGSSLCAQPAIAYVQPDQATRGMTLALEVLAPVSRTNAFGPDGLSMEAKIELLDKEDSLRVIFGIPAVSWQGRLLQVPFFVLPNAFPGQVRFRVKVGALFSNVDSVEILSQAQNIPPFGGDVRIGDLFGKLSKRRDK